MMKQHLPRILLTLLGLILMTWGIAIPMLGLVGETTDATVTHVRRQGGERNEALPDRYTHVISYRFSLPTRQKIDGFSYVLGSSYGIPSSQGGKQVKVRYLPLFPYLNTLEKQARPNLEHLIVLGVGYLLAFGLWRKKRSGKGRKRKAGVTKQAEEKKEP